MNPTSHFAQQQSFSVCVNWEKQECQEHQDQFAVYKACKVPVTYAIMKTPFLKSLKAINPT